MTHAVRAGARLLGDFNDYASWKVGAAYEHVFDGDAESAVNSFSLDVPIRVSGLRSSPGESVPRDVSPPTTPHPATVAEASD